jgi:hypothetical protein
MKRLWSLTRLVNHVGRRGIFLLFLALVDIIVGLSIMWQPETFPGLGRALPITVWQWWWLGTGIVLIPGAFMVRDRVFFALAAFLKAAWSARWVWIWVSVPQIPRPWVSVVVWGAFAGIVLVIASWPEVTVIRPHHD